MALTTEDGTGKSDAESFVSLADAETYFTNHVAPAQWSAASDAQKEAALRYATAWVDLGFDWPGSVVSTSQALGWPREGVTDRDGREIASNVVPQSVQDATCEVAAVHLSKAVNEVLARGGQISRLKISPVELDTGGSRFFAWVRSILSPIARPRSYATVRRA